MVVRNAAGSFLMAIVASERSQWEPELAQARAMLYGLRSTIQHQLLPVIIESDCQALVKQIGNDERKMTEVESIVEEIEAIAAGA
ncbi:unnamed protein product [Linum trigynum]|uniref:RNase H type-1 domain-containing protein n=1 Tax=Linum trigynum TaxID=586398 RepID=A0AAV2CZ07_9ROSI